MSIPLVSIALCTYNGAAYLRQQLDSLLAQNYPDVELVVSDDASTDGTWEILETYVPKFATMRLVRNPSTRGIGSNFEQALRSCQGEWIAPCDQDDIWLPNKLSSMLAAAGDAALVYCDSELIDGDGQPLGARVSDRVHMISGSDPRVFTFSNCVSGHAMLLRRSLLKSALPIPEGAYYDWWIAFIAASVGSIHYVNEPLVLFRQHRLNASGFTGQLKQRPKQSAMAKYVAQTRNLESLASFPGPYQTFFQHVLTLWRERPRRWITPALAALLYRHRDVVFAMKKASTDGSKVRHVFKYFWGLRHKRVSADTVC